MRIAITASGTDLKSSTDQRFGRAPFVLIIEPERDEVEVVDNSDNMQAAHDAGIKTAQEMVNRHVDWVITGHVGPKALKVLEMGRIKVSENSSGTCQEAYARFIEEGASTISASGFRKQRERHHG